MTKQPSDPPTPAPPYQVPIPERFRDMPWDDLPPAIKVKIDPAWKP